MAHQPSPRICEDLNFTRRGGIPFHGRSGFPTQQITRSSSTLAAFIPFGGAAKPTLRLDESIYYYQLSPKYEDLEEP